MQRTTQIPLIYPNDSQCNVLCPYLFNSLRPQKGPCHHYSVVKAIRFPDCLYQNYLAMTSEPGCGRDNTCYNLYWGVFGKEILLYYLFQSLVSRPNVEAVRGVLGSATQKQKYGSPVGLPLACRMSICA